MLFSFYKHVLLIRHGGEGPYITLQMSMNGYLETMLWFPNVIMESCQTMMKINGLSQAQMPIWGWPVSWWTPDFSILSIITPTLGNILICGLILLVFSTKCKQLPLLRKKHRYIHHHNSVCDENMHPCNPIGNNKHFLDGMCKMLLFNMYVSLISFKKKKEALCWGDEFCLIFQEKNGFPHRYLKTT